MSHEPSPPAPVVVNLRQARKQKARTEKEQRAASNREKFGESKASRLARSQEEERRQKVLDGHQRTSPPEEAASSVVSLPFRCGTKPQTPSHE